MSDTGYKPLHKIILDFTMRLRFIGYGPSGKAQMRKLGGSLAWICWLDWLFFISA